MPNYTIYVKSTTLGQTGLHWRNISQENQPRETPILLTEILENEETGFEGTVNSIINTNTLSLMLFRCRNRLLIEVTGLYSPARTDKMGRKVFNSLVLQGEDTSENEKIFRLLAISALDNITDKDKSLEKTVDLAVDFKGKEEFEVAANTLEKFIKCLESKYKIQSPTLPKTVKEYYIQNKDTGLEQVTSEILDNGLPGSWKDWYGEERKDGILIAVTEQLIDKGIFHKAGVWCGLADEVIEPEKPKPQVTTQKKSVEKEEEKPIQEEVIPIQQQKKTTNTQSKTLPMLILLLVIIVVITLIIVQQSQEPKEQPQSIPIPQELISPSSPKVI